jgi:hypothetical protein
MFNPEFYDSALSKEIKSYIDPYIHYLLVLQEELSDEDIEVYDFINDMIEQPPSEVDQYKLFIIVCCYSTHVNTILSVIDNLNLDMNHPYLNNFDAYPTTVEGLQCAIDRGRDLQLVRECRNIHAWLQNPLLSDLLFIDFGDDGIRFAPDEPIHLNVDCLEGYIRIKMFIPLELYMYYWRTWGERYDKIRIYLYNSSGRFLMKSLKIVTSFLIHYKFIADD